MFTNTTISALPHNLVLASSPYEITPELGLFSAVTLKSCSLEPSQGPCLFEEVEPGIFMNRWGLDNPGVAKVMQDVLPRVLEVQPNVVVSMFCSTPEEVAPFLSHVPFDKIKGIEVNISCPNTKMLKAHSEILHEARRVIAHRTPLGVKFHPENIHSTLPYWGLDFLTFANSIPSFHPTFGLGGQSGTLLKARVQEKFSRVRELFKGALIACGGVETSSDYKAYKDLGADYVAMASHYLKNKNIAYDILAGL